MARPLATPARVAFLILLAGAIVAALVGPEVVSTTAADRPATPPVLLRVAWTDSLPEGTTPSFQNGDTLVVDTFWDQDTLVVSALVTAVASSLTEPIPLQDLGAGQFRLTFEIPPGNGRPDAADLPLELTAVNAAADTVFDSSLRICLSNNPPRVTSLRIAPARRVFRGGDLLRIESRWSSEDNPDLQVWADLRALEPGLDSLIPAVAESGLHVLTYRIPPFPEDRAPDGTGLPIFLICRDSGCGETADSTLRIDLDQSLATPPTLLAFARLDTLKDGRGRSLRNGDTVRVWTRWDHDSLAISVDIFELAPQDTARPSVERVGVGEYSIVYRVPEDNARIDGSDIRICLRAQRQGGPVATDCSIRVCLNNFEPIHLRTYLREERQAYRGGDTLHIVTAWESPSGLPLRVGADVSRLQPSLADSLFPALEENDSLLIVFRIPTQEEDRGEDGTGIVLPIYAREIGGCGMGIENSIRITLDTTPPDTVAPQLNPLPAETVEDSILVSGQTVPEAFQVAITRQGIFQRYTKPDLTGRFAGYLRLLPDQENQIRVWAEDSLRNRTRSSDPQIVVQVSSTRVTFPEPFTAGAQLQVRDPGGLRDLRIRVFDLEGTLLRQWSFPGKSFERIVTWDARDESGVRLRSGYYLLRTDWREEQGSAHQLTEGLILRN